MRLQRLIPCQKSLFDIPKGVHYFNCAYISPLMKTAAAAIQEHGLLAERQPWRTRTHHFFEPVEEVRSLFAQLLGGGTSVVSADDVALVPSASYGVATAAANLSISKGQSILTLEAQYPSNVYHWQRLAEEQNAHLQIVPRPTNGDWTTAILEQITSEVAIAALPHCHWLDGGLLDLEVISRQLKNIGAALVLDLSQSLGAMPLDVEKIDPDFIVCAGYKWMLCPYSFSFLYVAPRHHSGKPLEENPMNRRDGDDFASMAVLKAEYANGARRFDMGERAQFALLPGVTVVLRQLLDWEPERVQSDLGSMTQLISERGSELGLVSLPPHQRAGNFVGLKYSKGLGNLAEHLADAGVYVSVRGDSLRVSPHLWNDEEDIDKLFRVLQTALSS